MPNVRPTQLTPYPVNSALKAVTGGVPGTLCITMSVGQWDALLEEAYKTGWILLELDSNEIPVAAYRLES